MSMTSTVSLAGLLGRAGKADTCIGNQHINLSVTDDDVVDAGLHTCVILHIQCVNSATLPNLDPYHHGLQQLIKCQDPSHQ